MGLFDSIAAGFRKLTAGVDEELLATGVLARGELLDLSLSGTTVTIMNGPVERACTFRVRVLRDGVEPYEATVTQRVTEIMIPQLQQVGLGLALRVDPNDPQRIAIDFSQQAPEVRLPEKTGPGSAAHILEHGTPVTAVLVSNQPLGVLNHAGDPVHGLMLTIIPGEGDPYQVQVGNAVPAFALPLLYPGSKVHAKRGEAADDVVVDWAAGPAS